MDNISYKFFTERSEYDKAINSLKGILAGINIDGIVNDNELKELNLWCSYHAKYLNKNPFKEFALVIKQITITSEDRSEAIQDLYWLCHKYENENFYYDAITSDLQELHGICHGILADGEVSNEEIFALSTWLDKHFHLTTYYPYDELNALVLAVVSDREISDDERKRLKAYFNEFANLSNTTTKSSILEDIKNVNISGICTPSPSIDFEAKIFCFTGFSKVAPRQKISETITNLGGVFTNSVSSKTDYLIVGNTENPCWAFACYGRKVERAMELRKSGHKISVIHELDFWDIIEDLK